MSLPKNLRTLKTNFESADGIVKLHVTYENSHKIWSIEAQKIISLATDKLDIGTVKEVLGVFIVNVHVPDENFHEIWSNEAQKIISLALIS